MRKTKILKLTIFTVAVFGLGVFVFSGEARAANWYANSNCANDGNGTAATCAASPGGVGARKVLFDAINGVNVTAGDTIIAMDGTYSVYNSAEPNYIAYIRKTGTAENRLTIKAQNIGGAIIDCGGKGSYIGLPKRGVHFSGNKSYVTIDGLTIHNCSIGISINANNDHVILKNNTIYDVWTGISGGSDCDYMTTDGNIVHDFGINIGDPSLDNQAHGIYFRGIDGVVQNNLVYNNNGKGWSVQIGGYTTPPTGIWKFVNNTLEGSLNSTDVCIVFYSFNPSAVIMNNNICYGATTGLVSIGSRVWGSTWEAKNNLIESSSAICRSVSPGNCNLCDGTRCVGNITNVNPDFIDLANENYSLANTSSAIDAGSTIYAPAYDINGTYRPQGAGYDIGAYEYISEPQTYYIDDSGDRSDSYDGSINKPWATFAYAMTQLKPGDTLLLKDGTYTESLNITVSGTEGNPITIRADNDGQVFIDAQGSGTPLKISGNYIVLSGLITQNSNWNVIDVLGDHNILRRVSAYATIGANASHFLIGGNYNLLEDCSAAGTGRKNYLILDGSNNTLRRCFGQFTNSLTGEGNGINVYAGTSSDNNLIENSVIFNINSSQAIDAFGNNCNFGSSNKNNKWYGNIAVSKYSGVTNSGFKVTNRPDNSSSCLDGSMDGNEFINNVSIGSKWGVRFDGGTNIIANHLTLVGNTQYGILGAVFAPQPRSTTASIRNSSIFTGDVGFTEENSAVMNITNDYLYFYVVTNPYTGKATAGVHDMTDINPSYAFDTYGKGAYLMVPPALQGQGCSVATYPCPSGQETDIGAKVLYRYEDGILTTAQLWPWPMESRICAETGYSVTYENPTNCKQNGTNASYGGGLWKTLDDVYDNPADVNSDTRVNIKDIQEVIRCIINSGTCNFPDRSDVNYDDSVNIKDIQVIIHCIVDPKCGNS